jgi:hypothetical protein
MKIEAIAELTIMWAKIALIIVIGITIHSLGKAVTGYIDAQQGGCTVILKTEIGP